VRRVEDVRAQVLDAAHRRALALVTGDRDRLLALLHPDFRWTSHTGEQFDRASYVAANVGGSTTWAGQQLVDVEILVHRDAAVLRCVVVDRVDRGAGVEEYRMPMTQVWARHARQWSCLAGHAGPRKSG
jgi:ketosteroid isomerase-like protein